jgi:hypothetical protein
MVLPCPQSDISSPNTTRVGLLGLDIVAMLLLLSLKDDFSTGRIKRYSNYNYNGQKKAQLAWFGVTFWSLSELFG